ncbi:MAG: DUF4870 domain-containing protein [Xanthomonadales bacterium]|nr:DUF4870 domain-containing protein [Xanthomonadales bacterium]
MTTREANQWAMFIHFSIFAGVIVPYAGLIVPIVIWQLKKDEFPSLTAHAYVVLNWIISVIIYSLICAVLTLILVGVLGFVVLGILCIVFPLIGGIKANEGELWEYPLSIRFFK